MTKPRVVRVTVDHNLCVGSQMCLGVDPAHFTLNDEARAVYSATEIDEELAREAAEVCPMAAIQLTVEE